MFFVKAKFVASGYGAFVSLLQLIARWPVLLLMHMLVPVMSVWLVAKIIPLFVKLFFYTFFFIYFVLPLTIDSMSFFYNAPLIFHYWLHFISGCIFCTARIKRFVHVHILQTDVKRGMKVLGVFFFSSGRPYLKIMSYQIKLFL